jgi:hypothetical protein
MAAPRGYERYAHVLALTTWIESKIVSNPVGNPFKWFPTYRDIIGALSFVGDDDLYRMWLAKCEGTLTVKAVSDAIAKGLPDTMGKRGLWEFVDRLLRLWFVKE